MNLWRCCLNITHNGKLHNMKRSYGWEDLIEPLEGGLTCMIMAMYGTMMDFKKYEDKQREKAEKV